MSGYPIGPEPEEIVMREAETMAERNAAKDLELVQLLCGIDPGPTDFMIADALEGWIRKAQEEREARERAEKALKILAGRLDCGDCPEWDPGHCKREPICVDKIIAWALAQAQEVKADGCR